VGEDGGKAVGFVEAGDGAGGLLEESFVSHGPLAQESPPNSTRTEPERSEHPKQWTMRVRKEAG